MKQGQDSPREHPSYPQRRGQRTAGSQSRPARARGRRASSRTALYSAGAGAAPESASSDPPVARVTPFSRLLQQILKRDRTTLLRVATTLNVSENTLYRWMNGISEPRPAYLKQLLDVLPEHRRDLLAAMQQSFPHLADGPSIGELPAVPKELYAQVLELRAWIPEDDTRRWQILQLIFDHAIKHLDAEQLGIALTYAELMPPHEDGIHSLYEAEIRATDPWSSNQESRAFLGSTTLAGTAAMSQHLQTWSDLNPEQRRQYVVEQFERSACACPVMYAGRCAGVLIVSSTQPDFFRPSVCQAVSEYAQLVSLGLKEEAFYDPALLHLRPMPDIHWQRQEISSSFINRVIDYARKHQLSRQEAELRVRQELEAEFEQMAPLHFAS
jgi:transcriptional regulator with XRE-family HTH domain